MSRWATVEVVPGEVVKTPDGVRQQYMRVLWKADKVLRELSGGEMSEPAWKLECLEYLLSEAEHGLDEQLGGLLGGKHQPYYYARLAALERDDWRCVICKHSRIGRRVVSALDTHHIIPRSHALECRGLFGESVDTPTNLVTLCRTCHESVTNPITPAWHWRAIAPRLFELIGETEKAEKMRRMQ